MPHAVDLCTNAVPGAILLAQPDGTGGIDGVVHVVGGSSAPSGGFAKLIDDEWAKAFSLNLYPAVRPGVRAARRTRLQIWNASPRVALPAGR